MPANRDLKALYSKLLFLLLFLFLDEDFIAIRSLCIILMYIRCTVLFRQKITYTYTPFDVIRIMKC